MDKIFIENVEVKAFHGVLANEKEEGQRFVLNIVIDVDLKRAGNSDKLSDTIDYGKAANIALIEFSENSCDLIETAALSVANKIMDEFPAVEGIQVKVSKPEAPVPKEVGDIGVIIERKRETAFLSLGSNIGDRDKNLQRALDAIGDIEGTKVKKVSAFLETKPWGNVEQEDFLNCAVCIETYLSPMELLKKTQEIENKLGRIRIEKWGPRIIDIDLLMMGSQIINTEELMVPHPYMTKRDFVMEPLKEIAPFFIYPLDNRRIIDIDDYKSE